MRQFLKQVFLLLKDFWRVRMCKYSLMIELDKQAITNGPTPLNRLF